MSVRTFGLATAAAVGLALAAPAAAADFSLTVGTVAGVPANNDFKTQLAGIGLVNYTDVGASLAITGPVPLAGATLKFEFVAREAGFNNSFHTKDFSWTSAPPSFQPWDQAKLIGTGLYTAGPVTDWLFKRPDGTPFGIGTQQFGIFIPAGLSAGDVFKSRVLYLGFDDTGAGPDDNHDDIILRVTLVPEPATWAMLIAGFGLVGFSLRRRKTAEHVTA
jgi:hypothetical protein